MPDVFDVDGDLVLTDPTADVACAPMVRVPQFRNEVLGIVCTFDPHTPEGRSRLFAALSPGTLGMGPDGSLLIELVAFCQYPDRHVNQDTGEEIVITRTMLFDRSGGTFRSSSSCLSAKVRLMAQLFTLPELEAGVLVQIVVRQSKRPDRKYHDLVFPGQK